MADPRSGVLQFLSSHSKALSLAVGLTLLAVSALYLWCRRCPPKPTLTVSILSKEALIDLLQSIRKRHSEAALALRKTARRKRRLYDRDSQQYRQCILHYQEKARTLVREASKTTIREFGMSDSVVLASCNFYEGDDDIDDAKRKLSILINSVRLPRSFDLDKAKEVYLFSWDKSREILNDSYGDFMVRNAALEDEVWERFGYEMEEVEKAFEHYKRELKALETQLHLHGRGSFSLPRPPGEDL